MFPLFTFKSSVFPTIDNLISGFMSLKIFNNENIPFSTFILPTYKILGLSKTGLQVSSCHFSSSSDG